LKSRRTFQRRHFFVALASLTLLATVASAQIGGWGLGGRPGGGGGRRPLPDRSSFPSWNIDPNFRSDVFTFVRVEFDSYGPFGWHDRWDNDFPDGDWNFSLRLQQIKSL
jgi:hypothetical protein